MQSVTLIRYQTSDGTLFEDEDAAKTHEALLAERALIVSYADSIGATNPRHRSRIISTLENYIQFRAKAA